ncbi:unnamed protein product, partial [Meganyctiphanes norvegica]
MIATPATPQVSSTGGSLVKVYVRTRPLLGTELKGNERNIITINNNDNQVVVDDNLGDKVYHYDGVFDVQATQTQVYESVVAPLVGKVQNGGNATVIAYGQTGSGKTHTMGTDHNTAKADAGVLQRAMRTLLGYDDDNLENCDNTSMKLHISFCEVYNEKLYDLLASTRTPVTTHPDNYGGLKPVGMVEEQITNVEEGLKLLERGSCLRTVAATAMNQHSSRSHALIFITPTPMEGNKKYGSLRLVDLAGAESAGHAQTKGQQLKEGVDINKGLLTLGQVLAALSNSSTGFVPFRNSILTRLLVSSLSFGSHTAMIACVNPSKKSLYYTINTLRYAEQARNVKTRQAALSTVKRYNHPVTGTKRRLEDVTATPAAMKRRAIALNSSKKPEHNATVSTPGNKPAQSRITHKFNATIATPSERVSTMPISSTISHISVMPPPESFSAFKQPIFDQEESPSRFSNISGFEDIDDAQTEKIDKVGQKLEKTIVTQMAKIEDRLPDLIINKLIKKGRKKKAKKNKASLHKSKISTPTDGNSSEEQESMDSSSDRSFGTSLANALFGGLDVKSMLQDMVQSAVQNATQNLAQNITIAQNQTIVTRPTRKSTRLSLAFQKVAEESPSFNRKALGDITNKNLSENEKENIPNAALKLPITSTVFNESQNKRRSGMSSRLSNVFKVDNVGTRNDMEIKSQPCDLGSSPALRAPKVTNERANDSDFMVPENLKLSTSPLQIDRIARRSARKSTLTVANQNEDENLRKKPIRQSSRLSAIVATQKNFKIYQNQSPATNLQNMTKPNDSKVCMIATETPSAEGKSNSGKWKLVLSPSLQNRHNASILETLNNGNLKQLQQLPTVGPKTAFVIQNFRELYGKYENVEDLKNIPALPKSYFQRFMKANLMNQLCF